MANFVFYDLTFLVLFTLGVVFFLYRRRHNLKRQGILYLYHTKLGIKMMDWTVKRFGPLLRPLEYIVVASGYILMVVMVWLLVQFTYVYSKFDIASQIKIPPVLPLFPYATDLFKVDFLPPFYFTYWIVIIAIVAISHEFAHGIFARLHKIKVKSTGFGFLGPFLAAFVEPDEKQMQKTKKFNQLSILAAGTFANILMTILFALILWGFFASSFVAGGVNFNAYPQAVVSVASISAINGNILDDISMIPEYTNDERFNAITVEGDSYLIPTENLNTALEEDIEHITVFEDAPAINAELAGPITAIDDTAIYGHQDLRDTIATYQPGDTVTITTVDSDNEPMTTEIELADRGDGSAYLGVGFLQPPRGQISGAIYSVVETVKDPTVHYVPTWNSDLAWFIYNLLWWTVLINISVALINMLPVGIFDGGRFFYLTIWGITGKEKIGRYAFAFATWAILAVLLWLMVVWAIAFF